MKIVTQKYTASQLTKMYYDLKSKEKIADLSFEERVNTAFDITQGLKENDLYFYRRSKEEFNYISNRPDVGTDFSSDSIINLGSNDYLNFTNHPKIIEENIRASKAYGVGSGSVPMLTGTHAVHKQLEKKLASFLGYDSAITYNSCYAANYGLLTTILSPSDAVILDTYVHASIIDGCNHAKKTYFNHNDPESLKYALKRTSAFKNRLVIIEGVYSMDGDVAKLNELLGIAKENGAWIMVDESHSLGVLGHKGKGIHSHFGITEKADITTCSMGKALGGIGGFIAGSRELINLLELTSRTFIYSTSIPPNTAASLIKALELIEEDGNSFRKLWENIAYFKERLKEVWLEAGNSDTAIFPLIIKDEIKLLSMCRTLHQQGVFVIPVFYPVVPRKRSRIRLAVNAGLSKGDLDFAIDRITRTAQTYRII